MSTKECRRCEFWEELGQTDSQHPQPGTPVGYCKRYPPQIFQHIEDGKTVYELSRSIFPLTTGIDFCGEFIPNKRNQHV